MTIEDVRYALAASGLTTLLAQVDTLAQPAIRIAAQAAGPSGVAVGASALGGQPDLAPGTAWPAKQGAPLSFVGQIRLEAVAPYESAHLLPPKGLLSFFYDAQQETYGTDPTDRAGFAVLYTADASGVQRQPFPNALAAPARFAPRVVTFSAGVTLPVTPTVALPQLAWTPDQQQTYEAVLANVPGGPLAQGVSARNQLLGFPDTLQDDMRLECQLASHGVSMAASATDPRTASLAVGAENWQLLFQLDSDEQTGMHWGDGGMLYYWIERKALDGCDFSQAWVVLQSN
ncbi:MAG: YwqG family protein [Ktedonobacterales bacterium]